MPYERDTMSTYSQFSVDHTDAEAHAWFIHEMESDLRSGLERFAMDSPNSSYTHPLLHSTQTLLDGKDADWMWEYDSIDSLEVTHQLTGYGADYVYENSETVCIKCASETHGIYLRLRVYQDAMGLSLADSSDDSCEVICSECNDVIHEHPDTDLNPCRECDGIYHGGKRIEVPTFDRYVTDWHQITMTQAMCLHLCCAHTLTDIDATFALTHHLRTAYDWAKSYNKPTYPFLHGYYGIARNYAYAPYLNPSLHCQQCFDALLATLEPEDFECWNCEENMSWQRAYVCKQAGETPKHDQEGKYVPGDGPDSDGIHASRYVKFCVDAA
jgi:hypothetical protein